MRSILSIGLVLAAVVFAAPVGAQTAGAFMTNPAFADPPPARCVSTLEMQHCAAHELRIADAAMSGRYAELRARLGAAERQKLLVRQRAWLKSRDRDCLARGRSGATMASLNVARCWVDVTKARATALGKLSARAVR